MNKSLFISFHYEIDSNFINRLPSGRVEDINKSEPYLFISFPLSAHQLFYEIESIG